MGDRAVIKTVLLDGAAYRSGLNAGDEIISINGLRFLKEDVDKISSTFMLNHSYDITISRMGQIIEFPIMFEKAARSLKEIKVLDRSLVEKSFKL